MWTKIDFPLFGSLLSFPHALLFTLHAISKIDFSGSASTFKYILLASPFF